MRRSLGYKLQAQGRLLLDFVDYLQHTGAPTITVEAALAWATQPVGVAPIWWKRRLSVVRCFTRHLKTLDPAGQVPPTDLLPAPYQRITPHLYSPTEIAVLVHAAGILVVPCRRHLPGADQPARRQRPAGSEAIRLDRGEVDLNARLLTITNSKFGKSRKVSLHPTTAGMLRRYTARRDRLCPAPTTRSFFLSTTGTRLLVDSVDAVFTQFLSLAGIHPPPGRRRPRIHACAIPSRSPRCWTGTVTASTPAQCHLA